MRLWLAVGKVQLSLTPWRVIIIVRCGAHRIWFGVPMAVRSADDSLPRGAPDSLPVCIVSY